MTQEKAKEKYDELFATEADKAAAFDEIARRFYFANFATMSKSDFETLLFSLYLEQILNCSENNYDAYSDYTLSKVLGVPQSRISTLKVRKELQYPYSKFNWKESFKRISQRAIYEGRKIRLYIPTGIYIWKSKMPLKPAAGMWKCSFLPIFCRFVRNTSLTWFLPYPMMMTAKKRVKKSKREPKKKTRPLSSWRENRLDSNLGDSLRK